MNGKVLMVNGKNNDILKIVVAIKEGYLTKDNVLVFKYYYVFSYIITYGGNLRLLLVICIISLVLL